MFHSLQTKCTYIISTISYGRLHKRVQKRMENENNLSDFNNRLLVFIDDPSDDYFSTL